MQLIVQVNSQRENQSESVAIISSRKKQNKTKQNKKSLIRKNKSAACMRDFGLC